MAAFDFDSMGDGGYIDSRGVDMGDISFRDALTTVRDMALVSLSRNNSLVRGQILHEITEHGKAAIATVDTILEDTVFLDELKPSTQARKWAPKVTKVGGLSDDISNANIAVRTVLAMSKRVAHKPASVSGIAQADAVDREQVTFDMVEDLLGIHAKALSTWQPAPLTPGMP